MEALQFTLPGLSLIGHKVVDVLNINAVLLLSYWLDWGNDRSLFSGGSHPVGVAKRDLGEGRLLGSWLVRASLPKGKALDSTALGYWRNLVFHDFYFGGDHYGV